MQMLENIILFNYDPRKDKVYMSVPMCKYFNLKLLEWRAQIAQQEQNTLTVLGAGHQEMDFTELANIVAELRPINGLERQAKLIGEIDAALARIASEKYGYCEETGKPIGFDKLDAWPIARFCQDAKAENAKANLKNSGSINRLPSRRQ